MARAILYGTSVSPGIAIGKVSLMHAPSGIEERFVAPGQIDSEVENLTRAAAAVRDDLARARDAVPNELAEHRDVISSHMLICQDPKLLKGATTNIRDHFMCAPWALNNMIEALCATFRAMDDPYLRDRAQDIRAVGLRIQARLTGDGTDITPWDGPRIGLAEDLSPADALDLNVQHILALVTLEGGPTSHTAILARSLRIPAIVGVTGILKAASEGDFVVIDALKGSVYIDPDEKELEEFALRQEAYIAWEWSVRRGAHLPAETLDGVRIEVQANIKNAEEIDIVHSSGADGVGLYRTEFAYLKGTLPDEEQLYTEYSAVARQLAPKRVVFRTLDVGADKMLYAQSALKEPNPALGLRAIRFCLRHQNIFRTQLRALLRAGVHGNVALMFPMISGPQEIQAARGIIAEVVQELRAAGIEHAPNLPVGIMMEVPSAIFVADALARECDFFSIGTNDLIHYLMAIDRGNKHVSYLHEPLHPAVMRALKRIIDSAHREGIGVSVCGEMAADPFCLPILLGMGVDSISATAQSIPGIKHLIRSLDSEKCMDLARSVVMTNEVAAANSMVTETLSQDLRHDLAFHTTMIHTGS